MISDRSVQLTNPRWAHVERCGLSKTNFNGEQFFSSQMLSVVSHAKEMEMIREISKLGATNVSTVVKLLKNVTGDSAVPKSKVVGWWWEEGTKRMGCSLRSLGGGEAQAQGIWSETKLAPSQGTGWERNTTCWVTEVVFYSSTFVLFHWHHAIVVTARRWYLPLFFSPLISLIWSEVVVWNQGKDWQGMQGDWQRAMMKMMGFAAAAAASGVITVGHPGDGKILTFWGHCFLLLIFPSNFLLLVISFAIIPLLLRSPP